MSEQMATPLIVSFGSVNIDVTARARRLPKPGETVHGESYGIMLGGKGSNQAAAAARLAASEGVRVALVGRVGRDDFGARARRELEKFGVDLSPLREDPDHATGVALIGIESGTGENSITVIGGANMAVDESDSVAAEEWFGQTQVLLLQLEIPEVAVLTAAQRVRDAGGTVILDPAPVPNGGLSDAVLGAADIITPNETETGLLTGITPTTAKEASEAAKILQEKNIRRVLIKMGSRGVFWRDGADEGFCQPFVVKAIDTVAAGDSFNAGLAFALAKGQSFREAVCFAAACGALATTRNGAADAAPFYAEVCALIEQQGVR
ncbi:ribokinase [Neokomagataea thailandica NBRC 106555]|uniref:Ribokinase n=2 Tax=Neokomagataea TaxID=1223423 RepID=A0A4Y6VB49_9PROT|nr:MULTISPECIES: PfkB family carbohydrate kinase [Neokomagataea]QDH25920.1 ribokinase [Neokomagataea tanensis]GBR51500.1 ribokinase [Neokomagataea thailandica NBRC 106555]